jgi:hypothetical protein
VASKSNVGDLRGSLCDLEDAHDAFSRSFAGFVGGPTPKTYWEELANTGKVFREAFWKKRVLFDSDLANNLTLLNRAYVEISNSFFAQYGAARGSLRGSDDTEEKRRRIEYDALSNILHSERYRKIVSTITILQKEIEERFRSLFGVSC